MKAGASGDPVRGALALGVAALALAVGLQCKDLMDPAAVPLPLGNCVYEVIEDGRGQRTFFLAGPVTLPAALAAAGRPCRVDCGGPERPLPCGSSIRISRDGAVVRVTRIHGRRLASAGKRVDLNRATVTDLAFVPGISADLAVKIVAERDRRGGFCSAEDLCGISGIGPKKAAALSRVSYVEPVSWSTRNSLAFIGLDRPAPPAMSTAP